MTVHFQCSGALKLSRRKLVATLGGVVFGAGILLGMGGLGACSRSATEAPGEAEQESSAAETMQEPNLVRIKMTTIAAIDLAPIEEWYTNWLGYSVVERGEISAEVASSWGTPNMAGRAYLLMQPGKRRGRFHPCGQD